jgi:ZIP family zinc transporter
MSARMGMIEWLPPATGFAAGALFIYMLDRFVPHLHINFDPSRSEGPHTEWRRTTLLVLAITLHNIPEGLAVGVLFGGVAAGMPEASIGGAVALAIGIGLQNFPEGIAVSMPLRRQGVSKLRSFWFGQLSAIVEPVAGVLGAAAVMHMQVVLPYALAFAAGAMIYVVVEEVIPETQQDRYTDVATLGFIGGFIVMMVLDVALG